MTSRAEARYKRRLFAYMLLRTWPWRAWQIAYGTGYFIAPADRKLSPEEQHRIETHREIRRQLGSHQTPSLAAYKEDGMYQSVPKLPPPEQAEVLIDVAGSKDEYHSTGFIPDEGQLEYINVLENPNCTGFEYIYEDGNPYGPSTDQAEDR